ncbi:MAG: DUF2391 family protein [Candidatus Woesearchaeota archaeon]
MVSSTVLERIDKRLSRIEKRLTSIESSEKQTADFESLELDEMKKLEELEKEIERDVSAKPLARITYHDVTKGIIGSFFGIVGHFAFFYGGRIALEIDVWRAHALLVTSFLLLILFMYFSGFRPVNKNHKHRYLAWRVILIYAVAHVVITGVLFLFGQITFSMSGLEIYKNVATVSILAVMGAATADLIGGEH